MSVGLAEMLPAVVFEEATIAELFIEYLWSDLKARRYALSLWPEDLAPALGVDLARILLCEYEDVGDVPWRYAKELPAMRAYIAGHPGDPYEVPSEYISELAAMEAFVATEAQRLTTTAAAEGNTVTLNAAADQEAFIDRYPGAHTFDGIPYPVALHYVAVGRAAAELRRRGRDVEVFKGDRRFDLPAARFALGLGKAQTADLLGSHEKTYYKNERGVNPPPPVPMKELQRMDDFIASLVGELEISTEDGASVVWIHDDQAAFERAYPNAVIERSGKPYPVRTMWVAAALRAGALQSAGGGPVCIAVIAED
ncbi:hypothetical protein [Mycobacterium intracellulare]|uniref:hypothetical protein n=1 Tax=Mycobacterium intracellulare TaxID=1767 RepID=UPI001EEDAE73|nr:hypothetical protein [Mycobacterium intracellulare]MEE3755373.1 hypothetical protein [Mycobacterium intracellulare]